jgi:segregation and condensation protein B
VSGDNVVPFPGAGEAGGSPSTEAPPPTATAPSGLPPEVLEPMLEALLFAAGEPVTVTELVAAVGEVDPAAVRAALHELALRYAGRGIRLVKIGGGWQLRTDPRFADAVLRLRGGKPQRMSQAALESLAVIAYRQPVTRGEVDEIRGVSSGGVIKTLLEKGYLKVVGRRDEPGRPLEYGTTPLFLEMFELDSLQSLPTLAEREELARTDPAEGGAGTSQLVVPISELVSAPPAAPPDAD